MEVRRTMVPSANVNFSFFSLSRYSGGAQGWGRYLPDARNWKTAPPP
jgi:hypothetical protein